MKNKFFYPFHVMLSSELLSAQHEGTKCSEFFDVTGMKEKYEGLFHSAILGLDATYCSDGIKKSCILGLVLVRKDTHTTVPLAYDYAPSESSEYVASFLAKIFAKIADLLGLPSWIPAQIIIDKHDGLRLAHLWAVPFTHAPRDQWGEISLPRDQRGPTGNGSIQTCPPGANEGRI